MGKTAISPRIYNVDICVNLIRLKSGGKHLKPTRKLPRSPIKQILWSRWCTSGGRWPLFTNQTVRFGIPEVYPDSNLTDFFSLKQFLVNKLSELLLQRRNLEDLIRPHTPDYFIVPFLRRPLASAEVCADLKRENIAYERRNVSATGM